MEIPRTVCLSLSETIRTPRFPVSAEVKYPFHESVNLSPFTNPFHHISFPNFPLLTPPFSSSSVSLTPQRYSQKKVFGSTLLNEKQITFPSSTGLVSGRDYSYSRDERLTVFSSLSLLFSSSFSSRLPFNVHPVQVSSRINVDYTRDPTVFYYGC